MVTKFETFLNKQNLSKNTVAAYVWTVNYYLKHYGEIKNNDIANGEGVRVTLFVSGCTNRCKNCFQPQTWDFEFGKLGLPTPDCILYLEMRPDIARRLLAARSASTGRVQDIHEKSADHLDKSYLAALYASDALGWNRIRCFEGDDPRSIDDIHAQIMDTVAPYLS